MVHIDLLVLLLNAAVTWLMTGIIWFVQIVHYPLFDCVGTDFQNYAVRHRSLTSLVVVIPMLIEITSALFLAVMWKRADGLLLWLGFALVFSIWIGTALGSIPCHERLCSAGYSAATHQLLVSSNWFRTILWTLRSFLMSYVIYGVICRHAGS